MKYKEGKDFEWVPMKDKDGKVVKDGRGGAVKTRRFFTKAEKEAMKSGDKPKTKPESKPRSSSSAPAESKRPMLRTGKLNDDAKAARNNSFTNSGGPRRGSVKPKKKNARDPKNYTSSGRGDGTSEVKRRKQDNDRRTSLQKIRDNFNQKRTNARINLQKADNELQSLADKPSQREFINKKRQENPDEFRADPSGFLDRMRELYKQEYGYSKGGMVKSGNKDYKKSGMFYKSASPRGYK